MKRLLRAGAVLLGGLLVLAAVLASVYWTPDRTVGELAARWAPPPSQFLAVEGLQVHFRDEGPRGDPVPLVLLHGTSSSLHTWQGWTEALAPTRRVIRFDLPGFGLTGPEPEGDYTIQAYVRTVLAVLDRLGVQHGVLAGNSLGGYVAWATALEHPERVERLVLVDSAGYPYASESVPIGFRIARLPVIGRWLSYLMPRAVVEHSVREVYGDPSRVTPELVDRYYDLTTRAGNRGALAERFRQTQPGELARRIPELSLPTLILWGSRDRLIPPQFAMRFHEDIRGSRLVMLEGLGHVPQEEDPARSVAPLETFLASP